MHPPPFSRLGRTRSERQSTKQLGQSSERGASVQYQPRQTCVRATPGCGYDRNNGGRRQSGRARASKPHLAKRADKKSIRRRLRAPRFGITFDFNLKSMKTRSALQTQAGINFAPGINFTSWPYRTRRGARTYVCAARFGRIEAPEQRFAWASPLGPS